MQASGGVSSHLEQRRLDLRGKSVITDVHVLTLASD